MGLIHLTYYRLGFNMRLEIGDITTVDSYYKGSLPLSIAPPAARLCDSVPPLLRLSYLTAPFYPFHSWCSRDFIHYVSDIDYGLVFQLHLSEHLCIPPSILTLRSFASLFRNASPVHSYGGNARPSFYHFIRRRLLSLPIIVSFLIGDWKSVTYQPLTHIIRGRAQASASERANERALASEWYHPPSIPTYGPCFILRTHFYPFDSLCSERFNTDWLLMFREI